MQPLLSKFVPSSVSLRPPVRFAGISIPFGIAERPKPAKIQLPPPGNEKGHWHYEREYSRDTRYTKPLRGGAFNLIGILLEPIKHKELYPLFALPIFAVTLGSFILLISAFKIEVWLDRSGKNSYTPPWDWARVRDKYWKLPTQLYDPTGVTHERLLVMEQLEDELVEAAQKRGTRDARGYPLPLHSRGKGHSEAK
ncbi:hypothetical protein niasHT_025059 [Heterodera trifolii]|uniref:Uncharacterized protein n=1 Tax=Heterodera trifolii TaxID=157864 RepID=A0ABD2KL09_9BILA